jgi:hypothetical protein
VLAAGALVAASGCDAAGVRGSGTAAREERTIEPFAAIELAGPLVAEIAVGGAPRVEVSGDDNLVPLVKTEVRGGRLRVETTRTVRPKLDLVVRLAAPTLSALSVAGAGRVTLRGVASEDLFELESSGAAEITAEGATRRLRVKVSGAGSIDARALKAARAEVTVAGAGDLDVHASESLAVDIAGAADVRYHGNPPEVKKTIAGAGRVDPR